MPRFGFLGAVLALAACAPSPTVVNTIHPTQQPVTPTEIPRARTERRQRVPARAPQNLLGNTGRRSRRRQRDLAPKAIQLARQERAKARRAQRAERPQGVHA